MEKKVKEKKMLIGEDLSEIKFLLTIINFTISELHPKENVK